MENWKKIEEFDAYEVSDLGRVRSGENVLKECPGSHGYLQVSLCKEGTVVKRTIHRLVCLSFLPNPEGKRTVNHIDRNKANNRLENLEWATDSEQNIHSPSPIGVSGHRHIRQRRNGSWEVQIKRNNVCVFNRTFKTLSEAITARDEVITNLTSNPEVLASVPGALDATKDVPCQTR